jgi:hypothetical protein
LILDVLVNLAAAIVGWTLAQGLLVPRLRWSGRISKRALPDGGLDYRVKLKNVSWFRSVADLQLQATVWAVGVDPARPTTWVGIRVGTAPHNQKVLKPRRNSLVSLVASDVDDRMTGRLQTWGHETAAQQDRTLEQLLAVGRDTHVYVQVLGNDGWTGGTHYRESPRYTLDDITTQTFRTERNKLDRFLFPTRKARRCRLLIARSLVDALNPELKLVESAEERPVDGAPISTSSGKPRG